MFWYEMWSTYNFIADQNDYSGTRMPKLGNNVIEMPNKMYNANN